MWSIRNIAIGVLLAAITTLGSCAYVQTSRLAIAEKKVDTLELTIQKKDEAIRENNESIDELTYKYEQSQTLADAQRQKALKDVTRVQNIANRKAKLYEKLVNKDFKKTQNELRKVSSE
jgi:hypothetical protein